jgi:hypothetical protein
VRFQVLTAANMIALMWRQYVPLKRRSTSTLLASRIICIFKSRLYIQLPLGFKVLINNEPEKGMEVVVL